MLKTLIHWISDLLWPPSCVGCRTPGVRLCRACLDALPPPPPPGHAGDIPLIAAGTMRSRVLERAIWQLKYRNATDLAEPLGDLLAAAIGRAELPIDGLVPIPLHPARLRRRGYNQAQLLAKRVSAITGIPVRPVIVRTRNTASQVSVRRRSKRLTNLAGAFQVDGDVHGKRLVLIDDVTTTGATLQAAASVLQHAGAEVRAATVARG